jgi:hypothetical protein
VSRFDKKICICVFLCKEHVGKVMFSTKKLMKTLFLTTFFYEISCYSNKFKKNHVFIRFFETLPTCVSHIKYPYAKIFIEFGHKETDGG